MVTTVSFPGLGLEFELNRVAFSIGGFNVYWYGLLIGIGFMLAGTYALLNARKVGVDSDRLIDVVMVGLVCGVIGARLYYVIFDWETFQGDLSKIFDIRQGGLAIYGGILAGMAGGIIMAKIRKVRVRPAHGSGSSRIPDRTGHRTLGQLCECGGVRFQYQLHPRHDRPQGGGVSHPGQEFRQPPGPKVLTRTCRCIPPSCMSRCGA